VLLAGTGVGLWAMRVDDVRRVRRFLLTRGVWLIAVELLIINPLWLWSAYGSGGLFGFVQALDFDFVDKLWTVLHVGQTGFLVGGVWVEVLYPLIPWVGVICCGWAFLEVMALEAPAACVYALGTGREIGFWWPWQTPADFELRLALVWVAFAVIVPLLYLPCRWFAGLKQRRSEWWVRYLFVSWGAAS
jgi:uncharacterized membrane protein